MLLGQLYYYEKILDSITLPLTPEKLMQLDLPGINYLSSEGFRGLADSELAAQLRDIFIPSYGKLLQDENLTDSYKLWKRLTGPLNLEYEFEPRTPFQEKINSWQKGLHDSLTLQELINEGKYSLDPNDFYIYFGLRVIYTFSRLELETINNIDLNELISSLEPDQDNLEYSDKPGILVVCNESLSPLFANLNCECITRTSNHQLMVSQLKDVLANEPTIQMILIEGYHTEELVKYIRPSIDSSIVITQIHISHNSRGDEPQNFFDDLVKQTLGVRLT
ncbi:MAG: hypothetical protein OHK0017_01940 [Patescibacteria group bacterium]